MDEVRTALLWLWEWGRCRRGMAVDTGIYKKYLITTSYYFDILTL